MHAVSRAANRLMISLRRAIPAGRRSHPLIHAVSTEGNSVVKSVWILFVVCFAEWFRPGPSVQRLHSQGMWCCADGGKVWVAVPVLGALENVGDGAVLEQQLWLWLTSSGYGRMNDGAIWCDGERVPILNCWGSPREQGFVFIPLGHHPSSSASSILSSVSLISYWNSRH